MNGSNQVLLCGLLAVGANFVYSQTLTWNGVSNSVWDVSTQSWLNESSGAAAWMDGAAALFTGDAWVQVASGVTASAITFTGESSSATLTNGTITMISPAVLVVSNQSATIASALTAPSGLTVYGGGRQSFATFLTHAYQTVFTNVFLAELDSLSAQMDGGAVGGPYDALLYYPRNDGTNATMQFQIFRSKNGAVNAFTKCVKVQLLQSGSDVLGKVVYAKVYMAVGVNVLGIDFDATNNPTIQNASIATSASAGGYGILKLSAVPLHVQAGVLSGETSITGDLRVLNTSLTVQGVLNKGLFSGALTNEGIVIADSSAGQIFSGNISGTLGSLYVTGRGNAVTTTYTGYVPTNATTLFTNLSLAQITDVRGIMQGGSVGYRETRPYFLFNDGSNATVQLQAAYTASGSPVTKCVKIALKQSGNDILANCVYAGFLSEICEGNDFDNWKTSMSIATSGSTAGYGIHDLRLIASPAVRLTGSNSYGGGTVVDGGTLFAASSGSLPSAVNRELVTVKNGGRIVLNASASCETISAEKNSTIVLAYPFTTKQTTVVSLDNSVLECPLALSTTWVKPISDCRNYVNVMQLANGSHVTGSKIRLGNIGGTEAVIHALGTSPSFIESGLMLVNNSNVTNSLGVPYQQIVRLKVEDVTSDTNADLLISGTIADYWITNEKFTGTTLYKSGEGTVSFSGSNSYTGATVITKGTLSLDSNSALATNGAVVLAGGTLALNSSTNDCGSLTLTADSAIDLGTGAIVFDASAVMVWTNGVTLSLTGTLGKNSLRFGTNTSALTASQLEQIRYNKRRVILSAEGYVLEYPKGTVIKVM